MIMLAIALAFGGLVAGITIVVDDRCRAAWERRAREVRESCLLCDPHMAAFAQAVETLQSAISSVLPTIMEAYTALARAFAVFEPYLPKET